MIIKFKDTNFKENDLMKLNEYLINENFSGTLISLKGNHGKIKCIGEDRIYFIIEGTGVFEINEVEHKVEKFDLVFIPKNTPYNIKGKIKYFLLHHPKFKKGNDVKLD